MALQQNVPLIHVDCQDTTDLEKTLSLLVDDVPSRKYCTTRSLSGKPVPMSEELRQSLRLSDKVSVLGLMYTHHQ